MTMNALGAYGKQTVYKAGIETADLVDVRADNWKEFTVYSQASHFALPYVNAVERGERLIPNTYGRCILQVEWGDGGVNFTTYVEAGTPFSVAGSYINIKAFSLNTRGGTTLLGSGDTVCKVKCSVSEGRAAPPPCIWTFSDYGSVTGARGGIFFPFKDAKGPGSGGVVYEVEFINYGASVTTVTVLDGDLNEAYPATMPQDGSLDAHWVGNESAMFGLDRFDIAAGEKFSHDYGQGIAFQRSLYWEAGSGANVFARARFMPLGPIQ